nr:MAG TPA: hypothetical protein [Caudoviricetes sp.]
MSFAVGRCRPLRRQTNLRASTKAASSCYQQKPLRGKRREGI